MATGRPGRTVGVVLSAGESLRMGKPKALLDLGGRSFVGRIIDAMFAGGLDEVRVVTAGRHEAAIRAAVAAEPQRGESLRPIHNPNPEPGPISSLKCALAGLEGAAAVVHPVDIPALRGADVAELLAAVTDGVDAVIPSIDHRRAHPVWLAPRSVSRLLALPAGQTLRDYLNDDDTQVEYVISNNPLLRFDVDTPEAYVEVQRLWAAE